MSKYHQDSKSFQPEGLVKREKKPSSNWQPLNQLEQGSFQIDKEPPLSQTAKEVASGSEAAEPTITDNHPEPAKSPEIAKDTKASTNVPSSKEPQFDLSNYLERTVAEKKIETAFQEGIQAGIEKTEQDFGAATKAFLISCQQLDTIRETIIRNSSGELQEFALSIAEKIIRVSVREQDRTIIATIDEALQRAVKSDEFIIYIHPEDYQVVADNSDEIIAGLTGLNNIVIKKDTNIERGGAKIESDNCTIDATISGQFDLIREEIKKYL